MRIAIAGPLPLYADRIVKAVLRAAEEVAAAGEPGRLSWVDPRPAWVALSALVGYQRGLVAQPRSRASPSARAAGSTTAPLENGLGCVAVSTM